MKIQSPTHREIRFSVFKVISVGVVTGQIKLMIMQTGDSIEPPWGLGVRVPEVRRSYRRPSLHGPLPPPRPNFIFPHENDS